MVYTYSDMTEAEIYHKVTTERDLVIKNISQLEQEINSLTQNLSQAQQNLIASKGAVMGFDRILNAFAPPQPPAENS